MKLPFDEEFAENSSMLSIVYDLSDRVLRTRVNF